MRGLLPGNRDDIVGDAMLDKALPPWLRVAAGVVYFAAQCAAIGVLLVHRKWLGATGHTVYVVGVAILDVGVAVMVAAFALRALRQAGTEQGRGFWSEVAHALGGTFLYLLLPCMLLVTLSVLFAILTHQPGF